MRQEVQQSCAGGAGKNQKQMDLMEVSSPSRHAWVKDRTVNSAAIDKVMGIFC